MKKEILAHAKKKKRARKYVSVWEGISSPYGVRKEKEKR
jgi:hypothetical protein